MNKMCLYCNKEFTPESIRQKYCTHGCALKAKRERDIKNNKKRYKEKHESK